MAQPKEMKQDEEQNVIDKTRIYCTNALIVQVGRAIAVDLNQCMLPGNAKNKHMTILFRRGKKWTSEEIELVSKETDNWIKTKYGSNQAPVTFTIDEWGRKSCKVLGDLYDLCNHLRTTFNSLSDDEQREPHVELFTNGPGGKGRGRGRGRGRGKRDKDDTCRICGESGHFKRDCPQKKEKKNHKKEWKKGGKKESKNHGKGGKRKSFGGSSEKFQEKLGKMISRMQALKARKHEEIELLDEQEKKLQELLNNSDGLDVKTLRNEIKNIAKTFKIRRKEMKLKGKAFGKAFKGHKKRLKRATKSQKKLNKEERKEFNKKRKEQRKLEKAEKRRLKKEKLDKLNAARLDLLPQLKTEIGDNEILNIYVDGYNIIGCDSICRKNMRGRGGGMKKSRQRLMKLLQENFLNKIKDGQLKFDYNIIMKLWFDGNGKNTNYGDIEVTFSTKKQIVDDKLVELFSKNDKKQNSNILVITTDKELTLRLHQIGVKVMKSGTFYKTYLKEQKQEQNNNKEEDDEKKEDIAPDTNENDEDDFVQIMAKKLNFSQYSDEETPEGDNGSFNDDDDGDYTPDEAEGNYDNDNQKYGEETPDEDEEDYEFTSIFGEADMDIIDFD